MIPLPSDHTVPFIFSFPQPMMIHLVPSRTCFSYKLHRSSEMRDQGPNRGGVGRGGERGEREGVGGAGKEEEEEGFHHGYCPSHAWWVRTTGYERFQHHEVFSFGLSVICTGYVPTDEVSGRVLRLCVLQCLDTRHNISSLDKLRLGRFCLSKGMLGGMKVIIIIMTQGWSCFNQKVRLYDFLTSIPTWKTLGIWFCII